MSVALPSFAVLPLTSAALVFTQQQPDGDKGGQGEDFGKSSPVGLLVLILFLIAVAFLVRSMTKHLKRVPESFDKPEETSDETAESSASSEKTDHKA
ncbi:hypothetical protein AB5J62_36465 [Amycolatopsis sp. cg5]|uniref:hypothetical protein n=1 Tax=Amycolatopsis sp. cg5 TaxID=3238802 RepID=UPI0035244129